MKPLLRAGTILLLASLACRQTFLPATPLARSESIPAGAVKMTPAEDAWPPLVRGGWSQPVPLSGPINTAGAEDSPFIPADGGALYFFFTPDLNIPVERQIGDGLTGIWMASWQNDGWGEPVRVWLSRPGELSLDGCAFVLGDEMWFCSVRIGNLREVDLYTARRVNGVWNDWENAGRQINLEWQVGEMHITADGQELYFASSREGGFGGSDLWVARRSGNGWSQPVNLGANVNGAGNENRPFVTADGQELWFDAESQSGRPGPAIYRCRRGAEDAWEGCEEVIAQFAGEPTLTPDGMTLYFVHHYFSADLSRMIEADIYVSQRLGP
jgi:hypothetical protein